MQWRVLRHIFSVFLVQAESVRPGEAWRGLAKVALKANDNMKSVQMNKIPQTSLAKWGSYLASWSVAPA